MEDSALTAIAARLRYLVLQMTHKAGSGHPTTCFSSIELSAMLFFKYLRADIDNPDNLTNDRVIFSKGHASALLYAVYAVVGKLSEADLSGYRQFGSVLEGHPTVRFPYAETATGSLGQGLSTGAGLAWGLRKKFSVREKFDATIVPFSTPRVFVLMGDGEMAEGSVWEAVSWAGSKKLSNLIAIIDVNRFGQSDETMEKGDPEIYRRRFEAFGWGAIVVDGHDWGQLDAAYEKAITYHSGPVAVIAKTIKGKGIPLWEDKNGWHNKMLPPDELDKYLKIFQKEAGNIRGVIQKPELIHSNNSSKSTNHELSTINYTDHIPTKLAFGNALVRLGEANQNIIVLDGDVANSLHTDLFKAKFPDRFLNMNIAEQNMVGVATGLYQLGYLPVINTFAAFFTRAHDQIRMIPLSGVTAIFNGSYVGVSVGRDGPSQMGLEDLAMFRSIPGSTVLYPADPYAAERLTESALGLFGVIYIRTTREPTPVIYGPRDRFPVGGSYTHNSGKKEKITVIAAGITLHEALKAQHELEKNNIGIRVIDCYSVKPVDKKTLEKAAAETQALVVVEDHYPEGGLGDAVRSAIDGSKKPIYHLAVKKLPCSGSAAELLQDQGLNDISIFGLINHIIKTD